MVGVCIYLYLCDSDVFVARLRNSRKRVTHYWNIHGHLKCRTHLYQIVKCNTMRKLRKSFFVGLQFKGKHNNRMLYWDIFRQKRLDYTIAITIRGKLSLFFQLQLCNPTSGTIRKLSPESIVLEAFLLWRRSCTRQPASTSIYLWLYKEHTSWWQRQQQGDFRSFKVSNASQHFKRNAWSLVNYIWYIHSFLNLNCLWCNTKEVRSK